MPPNKMACSMLAQTYEVRANIRNTIKDIRSALKSLQRQKNSMIFGSGLFGGIADNVAAELASTVNAVASSIVSGIMKSYSAVAAAAMEAFLGPMLFILCSGPELVFSLVHLPLREAMNACSRERMYLNKAMQNIDIVISIISRWTLEIGGGKYIGKMEDALPHIRSAIKKCGTIISKLDISGLDINPSHQRDNTIRSAYFDRGLYNSMRNSIQLAIEITKSDSILVNHELIERRRRQYADDEYRKEQTVITKKYRDLGSEISIRYKKSSYSPKDFATYILATEALKRGRDIELKAARARADRKAALNKDLYEDIWLDISDKWAYDSQLLLSNLSLFAKHIGLAYANYKNSQSLTHSVYTIRAIINSLLNQMIKVISASGNKVGEGMIWSLEFSKQLLIRVEALFASSIDKFNSPDDSISSTGLAKNLAVGNGMLTVVDINLSATITQKLIDAVNADEVYNEKNRELSNLIQEIYDIKDWDGQAGVWAVNPLGSHVPPYVSLIASATAAVSTLTVSALVPDGSVMSVVQKKVIEMNRVFRTIKRHNGQVMGALSSYQSSSNSYVEQIRNVLAQNTNLILWMTAGANVFSVLSALTTLGLDKESLSDEWGDDVFPNEKNCRAAYEEMFPKEATTGIVMENSSRLPLTMIDSYTSSVEDNDMDGEVAYQNTRKISIRMDSRKDLYNGDVGVGETVSSRQRI